MIIAKDFTVLFKTLKLWSSKAAFTITLFAAINQNYDHKQQTLKHRNTQNGSKSTNHKSQIIVFWTHWLNFCFLKDPLRWLTTVKNANISWLLNFRMCVFMKSTVTRWYLFGQNEIWFPLFPNVNYSWSCLIRVWKLGWKLPSPCACILAMYMYQDEQDHVNRNA